MKKNEVNNVETELTYKEFFSTYKNYVMNQVIEKYYFSSLKKLFPSGK